MFTTAVEVSCASRHQPPNLAPAAANKYKGAIRSPDSDQDGAVMASFRGHLTFSATLGAAYGGLLAWQLGVDWGTAALAGGLTAVGGMMPDLDSDSGIPVREMFGLAAVVIPLMFL